MCLEFHNCDLEGFELIDLPALQQLRVATWDGLPDPMTLSIAKLPCLCFLDAPTAILRYIKAPWMTTASLTLERSRDAKVVISALMGWLKLENTSCGQYNLCMSYRALTSWAPYFQVGLGFRRLEQS